ncbi:SRPBCC family protein [soil metagenome]
MTASSSTTLHITIHRTPEQVYAFVSNPATLPQWAPAFCKSIRQTANGWIIDTPDGQVGLRFAETNAFGVLDHYVTLAPDVEIYVPMRVLKNGDVSEVIFTLFRLPGMSDADNARDRVMVEKDLAMLKTVMERS